MHVNLRPELNQVRQDKNECDRVEGSQSSRRNVPWKCALGGSGTRCSSARRVTVLVLEVAAASPSTTAAQIALMHICCRLCVCTSAARAVRSASAAAEIEDD